MSITKLFHISIFLIIASLSVFADSHNADKSKAIGDEENQSHINLSRTGKTKGLFKNMFTNMVVKQRIAPKRRKILETPSDYGMDYESIDIMSTDGIRLSAWKITAKDSQKLVVINHPLTCTRYGCDPLDKVGATYMPMLQHLNEAGYNILTYDQRGQGESDGGMGKTKIGKESPVGVGAIEWQDFIGVMNYVKTDSDFQDNALAILVQCMGANAAFTAFEHDPTLIDTMGIQAIVAVQPTMSYNMTSRLTALKVNMDLAQSVDDAQYKKIGYRHANSLNGATQIHIPILFTQVKKDAYTFDPGTGRNDVEIIYDRVPSEHKEILWIGSDEAKPYGTGKRFDAYNYFNDHPEDLLDFLQENINDEVAAL